jgi:hypothetical protein
MRTTAFDLRRVAPLRDQPFWIVTATFATLVTLTGGASRADSWAQPMVRTAAIFAIASAMILFRPAPDNRVKAGAFLLAALAALILLQLVPLPPAIWHQLPGRELYVDMLQLVGAADRWRPLSLTPDLGWNALLALLPPAATLVLLSRIDPRQDEHLLVGLLVLGIASMALALGQLSTGVGGPLRYYAITTPEGANGFFANRNHQATLLSLLLPITIAWGTSSLDRRRLARLGLAAALTVFTILMIPITGSRAGLLTGIIGLAGGILLARRNLEGTELRLSKRQRILLAGGLATTVAILIVSAVRLERAVAVNRLLLSKAEADPRSYLLEPMLDMAQTFLPWGSGFGSFDQAFRRFEPLERLTFTYMNQAHNDFLQVVIEGGIPAAILALIYLAWWGRMSFRLWVRPEGDEIVLGRLGSLMTLITLIASVPDYPLRTPLHAALFTLASALMLRHDGRDARRLTSPS